MITGIRFGKQWVRIRLIPYVERTVEVFIVQAQIDELGDGMREMEYGNCVGGQFVDFAGIQAQIDDQTNEL